VSRIVRELLSARRERPALNMTSLMDLTFMLLVAFIITFPLVEQGVSLRLPKAKAEPLPEENAAQVSLDADGVLWVGTLSMAEDAAVETLKSRSEGNEKFTVMLRADGGLPYEKVAHLLSRFREAGLTRIALVTDPRTPQDAD
jgi:biopolymer transport protein TolR